MTFAAGMKSSTSLPSPPPPPPLNEAGSVSTPAAAELSAATESRFVERNLGSKMSTVDEQLNPIAELRDELEYENIGLRIKAIRRLPTIARDIGEELTRNELIPFLSQIEEGIAEVTLAVELFIPYVGGVEHAPVLFPPLEKLCTAEDSNISDQAVELLCSIGSQMRESDVVEHFIPLVMGLANRGLAMARVFACRLCPIACQSVPGEFKRELVLIYHRLSLDDQPMVRRSAASNFGKFLAAVGVELASQSGVILMIFSDFMKDGDESVRSLAMEGFASLGKLLMPDELDYFHFIPTFLRFSKEESWLVHSVIANHLGELCEAKWLQLDPTSGLIPAYVRLLQDNEAGVRKAAARTVTQFCSNLSLDLAIQHILPCIKELSLDSSQHVRSALASVITGMAPVFGKDATIQKLVPIFLSLLKDEFPDVRLNIISQLVQVNQVIGIDVSSQSFLPAFIELAGDSDWRVREAIIEHITLFAVHLGQGAFDDKLCSLYMQSLQDEIHSIRNAAANNLKCLAEKFGSGWAMQHIVPQVLEMINHEDYMCRITILEVINLLAPVMGADIISSKFLPVVIAASKDSADAVRIEVTLLLMFILYLVDQSVAENTIRPCLVELSRDPVYQVRNISDKILKEMYDVKKS